MQPTAHGRANPSALHGKETTGPKFKGKDCREPCENQYGETVEPEHVRTSHLQEQLRRLGPHVQKETKYAIGLNFYQFPVSKINSKAYQLKTNRN